MPQDHLSDFFNKNQAIINSIALFSAFVAFFLDFLKDNELNSMVMLLPFTTILIVIFLVLYLYVMTEKITNPNKSFNVFKALLLLFLSFIVLFVFEYWNNFGGMLIKLGIALLVISIFLYLTKASIKNGWLLNSYITASISLIYLIVTLSIILFLATPNCDVNPFLSFTLLYLVFILTLYMFFVIIYIYTNIFEGIKYIKKKADKKKIKKILPLIFIAFLVALFIVGYSKHLGIIDWLANTLVWIIKLPRTLFC
nr:hypothetical protein [Candidatus Woesearchaeota archaeon]